MADGVPCSDPSHQLQMFLPVLFVFLPLSEPSQILPGSHPSVLLYLVLFTQVLVRGDISC